LATVAALLWPDGSTETRKNQDDGASTILTAFLQCQGRRYCPTPPLGKNLFSGRQGSG
jgi:hypothetical protein